MKTEMEKRERPNAGRSFLFFSPRSGRGELRFGKERTFECKGKNGVGLAPQDSAGKKGDFYAKDNAKT